MPSFSKTSKARLATCHPDIQKLWNEIIKEKDCIIICGARTLEDQQKAFAEGFSKIDGVTKKSEHQVSKEKPLSTAIDSLPYPIDWNDVKGHTEFARFVLAKAKSLNIGLEWGGDWKTFKDRPHFQLKN
jgi:hypothetical protein